MIFKRINMSLTVSTSKWGNITRAKWRMKANRVKFSRLTQMRRMKHSQILTNRINLNRKTLRKVALMEHKALSHLSYQMVLKSRTFAPLKIQLQIKKRLICSSVWRIKNQTKLMRLMTKLNSKPHNVSLQTNATTEHWSKTVCACWINLKSILRSWLCTINLLKPASSLGSQDFGRKRSSRRRMIWERSRLSSLHSKKTKWLCSSTFKIARVVTMASLGQMPLRVKRAVHHSISTLRSCSRNLFSTSTKLRSWMQSSLKNQNRP